MWRSFYENAELLELPLASMFLFFITFAAATALAWRQRDGRPAQMPLEDDTGRTP